MARGRFCSMCGVKFSYDLANFCVQCQTPREEYMPREEYELTFERKEESHQNEEASVNNVSDVRGPRHTESLHKNRTKKSPSYNTIFNPPPVKNRQLNKVYGKLSLRKDWAIQHHNLKDNYKQVKKWIKDGQDSGVLPQGTFTLEDTRVREALNKIIEENMNGLQELKFKDRGESYKWTKDNIYRNIKKHLKYKRQKERRLERMATEEAPEASHDAE